ncbi:2424_t:CDS:2, partial [Funneliformis geosporum]
MSLFFVVLAHPLPYPSQIIIAEEYIINEKKRIFSTCVALRTWKVEDLYEDSEKWELLKKLAKAYTETDIKNFGGKKLLSTSKFSVNFRDVPNTCIHITVQPPVTDDKPPTKRPRLINVLHGEQVLGISQMSWHEKSE